MNTLTLNFLDEQIIKLSIPMLEHTEYLPIGRKSVEAINTDDVDTIIEKFDMLKASNAKIAMAHLPAKLQVSFKTLFVVVDFLIWIRANLVKDGKIRFPLLKWPAIIKRVKDFVIELKNIFA